MAQITYNDTRRPTRINQVWDSDGYNFFKNNAVDLIPFLDSGIWSSTNLKLYTQWDGTFRIVGEAVYIPAGPDQGDVDLIALPVSVLDLSTVLSVDHVTFLNVSVGDAYTFEVLVPDGALNKIVVDQPAPAQLSAGDTLVIEYPLYPL